MLDRAAEEDRKIGRATTDVDNAGSQLFFIVCQHRVTRRQLFQNNVIDFEAATLHTLDDVLCSALCARDHMNLRFKAYTGHSNRLANTLLTVDQEFLWQYVQNFLVGRNRNGPCRVDNPIDIAGTHFFISYRDDAVRVQAANMAAGNTCIDGVNIASGH